MILCHYPNAFAAAACRAFYDHQPLLIRPDDIWFCIAQGIAIYVAENAEELRSTLVGHEGKKKLVVIREDFELGQENPWPEAFAAFTSQIRNEVPRLAEFVDTRFSTTGPIQKAAFDLCWMDAASNYFEYEMLAGCGIPEVVLLGTVEDWQLILQRANEIAELGLAAWSSALVPVVEKIVETAAGNFDRDFWQSLFRYQASSGPAELTGWIVTLFPYLVDDPSTGKRTPNIYLANWAERLDVSRSRSLGPWWMETEGPGLYAIPSSLVSAPLSFVDVRGGDAVVLSLTAGMFGVEQDAETGMVSAAYGWAVTHP